MAPKIVLPPIRLSKPPRWVLGVVGSLVLLLGGGALVLPTLVDKAAVKARVEAEITALTGVAPVFKGEPAFTFFPKPSLQLPAFEVAKEAQKFRAESAHVFFNLGTIFSKTPEITGVVLERPVAEMSTDETLDPAANWFSPALLWGKIAQAGGANVTVNQGKLYYRDPITKENTGIEELTFNLNSGNVSAPWVLQGHLLRDKTPYQFTATLGRTTGAPMLLRVGKEDGSVVEFQGTRVSDAFVSADGNLNVAWKQANATPATPTTPAQVATDALTVQGKLVVDDQLAVLSEANYTLFGNTATGAATLHFTPELSLQLSALFPVLNIDPVMAAATKLVEGDARQYMQISLQVDAPELKLKGRTYTDAVFKLDMDKNAASVNQFDFKMPGDTQVTLHGKFEKYDEELRFTGNSEVTGQNLKTLLGSIDTDAGQLPDQDFGQFYLKSNVFLSPAQLRLSEATMKVGTFELFGGVATYFEAQPRMDAEIRLKDTNLDYFRDNWRKRAEAASKEANPFMLYQGQSFAWLNRLQTVVDFKLNFDGFTFLDKKGKSGSLRIYAKQGELQLSGVRFYFDDNTVDTNFRINVTAERPAIDWVWTSNVFDMAYFDVSGKESKPLINLETPDARWSEQLFDFSWMAAMNGEFDLSVGQLTSGAAQVKNMKLKASLKDQSLNISRLSMNTLGGSFSAAGNLIGGKVPAIALSFTLSNADVPAVFALFSHIDKIAGKVSASGVVSAAGVHFSSWVAKAEANIAVVARGVRVQNFNLPGIVQSVQAARSTDDVKTSVEKLAFDGNTEFAIDGNLNIKDGSVRTPGIALKSGLSVANLGGEVKLMPWTMKANALYQFPQLSSETIPTMNVLLEGDVENYEIKIDTASLEAYVAKRIVGQ